jgi:diguanylate cyclase (GGDEF)-like protein
MAHRETFGVLYLSSLEKGVLSPAKKQLAIAVAEHIAPTLANLKLRETLKNQSIRDSLTGLFNRRYMQEALERELRRCDRKQQPLSIIMLDVDYFKRFNDTLGHDAGDAVLRELGRCLQNHVRGSDIACRYGGEEFTLILPEASLGVTQLRAEQIRAAAKQLQIECSGQSVGAITLSLGVASFPKHGLAGEDILKAADIALYRAKQEGRDRTIVA